jgi:hypothetical protein
VLKKRSTRALSPKRAPDRDDERFTVPQPISNSDSPIAYLGGLGEDLWTTKSTSTGVPVFSLGDLAVAKEAVVGTNAGVYEQLSSELGSHVAGEGPPESWPARVILEALDQTEGILTDCFGAAAYLRALFEENAETGEVELLAEAHYALHEEELREEDLLRHEEFISRFVGEVPLAAREHFVLVSVASDADTAE